MDISALRKPAPTGDGEWIGDIPSLPGVRLKVRGETYRPFDRAKSLRVAKAAGAKGEDAAVEVAVFGLGDLMADFLLTDWEGFTDGGEPLTYEAETAKWLLASDTPEGDAIRHGVMFAARQVVENTSKAVEALVGNSSAPSNGRSKTATKRSD